MAAFNTVSLFGLPIVSASQQEAIAGMLAASQEKRTAAFLNAHCMNIHKDDASYRWAVSKADYLLPDGSGMKLAARLQNKSFEANLNGTDLFAPLCQEAARLGRSIFFFGSQDGVADAASNRASELAPGLKIAGTRHGFFAKDDEADIIEAINRSGADIVLVALGVPMQDVWIARNRHKLDAAIVMGVGAQFDFFAGRVSRAPVIFRKAGCEWVWRLMIEPRRMAKRYLVGNVRFVFNAWREARVARAGATAATAVRGKRLLDIAVASSALIMLSPLMASTALAVAATSRGPVFFRQTRVGENGKPFTMLKFRSMYRDAEARRAALLETSDREGICFKSRKDPRVTPRRTDHAQALDRRTSADHQRAERRHVDRRSAASAAAGSRGLCARSHVAACRQARHYRPLAGLRARRNRLRAHAADGQRLYPLAQHRARPDDYRADRAGGFLRARRILRQFR